MKVKDVQIDGFGVWTGLSVDSMSEGMTVFYGPNEAGKTTLMQFLRAMLYGFTDDRRDKYLPPVHGGTPGGAVRVTGPGGGYQIRRHSQLTDSGATGQLSVTGQDGLSQGQHRLSMLLGQIDESIFSNVFAIGMRELQELGTLDDTSAADELYKLSSGLDRVSLVDVLKSLREARRGLIGDSRPESDTGAEKLANLIHKRQRLRDEVQSLTRGSRRWTELAAQRRAQQQEVEQLKERMSVWDRESRCVETATSVFAHWKQREELSQRITKTSQESQIPDEAPGQLVQIDAMMEDRRQKLEEIKNKRRAIRDKAEQLPVSRRLLDLQGRIEAAAEQATWVEALEEQIERLNGQIDRARSQLNTDAERFGVDEADRESLLRGETLQLPDLSRQTLAALSDPAKRVKEQLFLLKQGRKEGVEHKARAEQLEDRLKDVLARAHASNLQQAIRQENENVSALRHRMQLGEHLDKLKRHYRGLEKESVDLTTTEALPLDRVLLLSVPFIAGGLALVYGLSHVFGVDWFLASEPDPTWGMLYFMFGMMSMLVYHFGRQFGQRSTLLDMEDCDRQIDVLKRQIREIEAEREEVDSTLPNSNQALDLRIRDSEQLLAELESTLPTFHAHQAAMQSYKDARSRASTAAQRLKEARGVWAATLQRLGLSETMSPSSVRSLSDGYETLLASQRRLEELQEEREQRSRERQSLAKRIEMLYLESLEVGEATQRKEQGDGYEETPVAIRRRHAGPLEQLNHLHEELARQQHWIKRRRELKENDQNLKRQQSAMHRGIERGEQQRRALWAKCGVATPQQFYALVDTKAKLVELKSEFEALDQQIRSIIGTHVDYDQVAREIDGATANDLEKRWESLTTRMTETESRIAHLRTQQGELTAEMKHLGEDTRLATVQLELGCVERQIQGVLRRWQILGMASSLMEEVCRTFERERQPETLREASSFLNQLTNGKYTRIWTPLGTNKLKIDGEGRSLPLEVLSRGTREAVFIALRLSLAAAYARRGVMLPLVLDDVLVNFDGDRAVHAAQTLKTFADLGHQVMMFTCHEHIVDIFHHIDVEVRMLPPQGEPGRATVLLSDDLEEEYEEEEEELQEEEVLDEEIEADPPELEPVMIAAEPEREPEPVPEPRPHIIDAPRPRKPKPKPTPTPTRRPAAKPRVQQMPEPEPEPIRYAPAPSIQWAWFEQQTAGEKVPAEQRADRVLGAAQQALDLSQSGDPRPLDSLIESPDPEQIPDDVWNRNDSWWDGQRVVSR